MVPCVGTARNASGTTRVTKAMTWRSGARARNSSWTCGSRKERARRLAARRQGRPLSEGRPAAGPLRRCVHGDHVVAAGSSASSTALPNACWPCTTMRIEPSRPQPTRGCYRSRRGASRRNECRPGVWSGRRPRARCHRRCRGRVPGAPSQRRALRNEGGPVSRTLVPTAGPPSQRRTLSPRNGGPLSPPAPSRENRRHLPERSPNMPERTEKLFRELIEPLRVRRARRSSSSATSTRRRRPTSSRRRRPTSSSPRASSCSPSTRRGSRRRTPTASSSSSRRSTAAARTARSGT